MPRSKKAPETRVCQFCGSQFQSVRAGRFCPGTDHQVQFANLLTKRGKLVAAYVQAWIEGRGGGHAGSHPVAGKCQSEITAIARGWIEEDRAAGRPSMIAYVEDIFDAGFLYMDRRRPVKRGASAA